MPSSFEPYTQNIQPLTSNEWADYEFRLNARLKSDRYAAAKELGVRCLYMAQTQAEMFVEAYPELAQPKEDLVQIGVVGILTAARDYKKQKEAVSLQDLLSQEMQGAMYDSLFPSEDPTDPEEIVVLADQDQFGPDPYEILETRLNDQEFIASVEKIIARLKGREAEVFELGKMYRTFREIGSQLGISRGRAQNLRAKTLMRVKTEHDFRTRMVKVSKSQSPPTVGAGDTIRQQRRQSRLHDRFRDHSSISLINNMRRTEPAYFTILADNIAEIMAKKGGKRFDKHKVYKTLEKRSKYGIPYSDYIDTLRLMEEYGIVSLTQHPDSQTIQQIDYLQAKPKPPRQRKAFISYEGKRYDVPPVEPITHYKPNFVIVDPNTVSIKPKRFKRFRAWLNKSRSND